ncbi:hypothetical protein [Lichenicola sp.]|uniref:hypothetical protein n=1 Tax=Lichenicola sp. TaxID=2804529 RepID=UPI003AFF8E75
MTATAASAASGQPVRRRFGIRTLPGWLVAALLLLAGYALDHHPRFMLGDSESYLRSGLGGFYPPDRSWIYGVLVREIVSRTHSLQTYILLQLVGVLSLGLLAVRRLGAGRRPVMASAWLLAALCCDPLVQAYARFYLSDLSAALLFAAFVVQLAGLPTGACKVGAWTGLAACGVGAILCRIAYAPIEVVTVALCLAAGLLRRDRRAVVLLLPSLLVPVAGGGVLAAANHVVFARQYPGEIFLNRFSGIFLMSVFSPAITAPDIRSAGIAVTDDEVRDMRLEDYDLRTDQIWGTEPYWLRNRILSSLHAQGYDARADHTASRIVHAAFRRDPAAFVRVYANGLLLYAEPSEWAHHLITEMGMDRALDDSFVGLVGGWVPHALTPRRAFKPSLWPLLLTATIRLYATLLAIGLFGALWMLATTRDRAIRAVSAGLVADLLTVPLYSSYVIPRYLLAAVLLGWCLLWLLGSGRRPVQAVATQPAYPEEHEARLELIGSSGRPPGLR